MSTTNVATTASVYAPPPSRQFEPVAPSERIPGLDLLRGWAMFGVLWSNLNDWYGTADPTTGFDRALGTVQNYWLESRFYTLLCFLFGIGFGIQFMRLPIAFWPGQNRSAICSSMMMVRADGTASRSSK